MQAKRVSIITVALAMAALWAPAWGAPIAPLPEYRISRPDDTVFYVAQQKGLITEEGEAKTPKEDDLWEDDDALFEDDEKELTIADPLYYYNKGVWHFNDFVYLNIGIPAARGYNRFVPEPVRTGITNFFSNWYTPVRLVSCLLQAKWKEAGTETGRFVINTSFGILGFADLAREDDWTGWQVADEDMGQVFGAWGIGQGFYLMLPLLGPSTARDGVGRVANGFLDPFYYLDIKYWEYLGIVSFREFAQYAPYADEYRKFKEMSLDPYTAMRNAYLQFRARQVSE